MKKIIFFTLLCTASWAQDNWERQTTSAICDDSQKLCRYTTVNLLPGEIINQLAKMIYGGVTPAVSQDKYIFTNGPREIIFWDDDQAVREKIKTLLPILDKLDNFGEPVQIQVDINVVGMTESTLSEFNAELTGISTGQFGTDKDAHGGNGSFELGLNFGALTVSGLLTKHLQRGSAVTIENVSQPTYNREYLSYESTQPVYIPFPFEVIKDQKTGVTLHTTVFISNSAEPLILFQSFNFTYGAEIKENKVHTITIYKPSLLLKAGQTALLVSTDSVSDINSTDSGLLKYGKNKIKQSHRLVIAITARPIKNDGVQTDVLNPQFTDEQKQNLKEGSDLKNALSEIIPHVTRNIGQIPTLSFTIPEKNISRDDIDQNIKISVSKPGRDSEGVRQLQNLALKPYTLDIDQSQCSKKSYFKFKVSISPISNPKLKRDFDLFYNCETFDLQVLK